MMADPPVPTHPASSSSSSSSPTARLNCSISPVATHISRHDPMDPSPGPSDLHHGPSQHDHAPPSLRRRLSMEEDLFYQHIMTASQRRPSLPPPYEPGDSSGRRPSNGSRRSRDDGEAAVEERTGRPERNLDGYDVAETDDDLPDYSSSIAIDGVFQKKHEIENTTKRAEDRHWHTVFVSLNGTALNVYNVKKDWGWGRSRDGPSICPDRPPWVKKAKLEKSYNLQHADAGIAADYKKRRYVIRIRAETDQFLLSCIELTTFVKWLECLFAAIDVSAPLDDRDFPRDMSIPRIQRLRWFRGESPTRVPIDLPEETTESNERDGEDSSARRHSRRRSASTPPPHVMTHLAVEAEMRQVSVEEAGAASAIVDSDDDDHAAAPPPRIDPVHRLSTTSYPNLDVEPFSGKWWPEHSWSSAHDLLYAKLCYSNLLFRSPRKSNYIISKGKEWFVDWATGRMVRVLPPGYADTDYFFGPWQVVHTDNRRI